MAKSHLFACYLFIYLTIMGCSEKTPQTEPSKGDPVAEYKLFINDELERYNKLRGDMDLRIISGTKKIDVRKTDSLISPVVGTCKVGATYPMVFKNFTVDYAGNEPDPGALAVMVELDLSHNCQDGTWRLTAGAGTITGCVFLQECKSSSNNDNMSLAGAEMKGRGFKFGSLEELLELTD